MTGKITIPGYAIKKRLGQGGMASVYLGVQRSHKRLSAIKIFQPESFGDPILAIRFLKETQTLQKLIHPNIVSIYDVGELESCYFIAMEFFQQSLKERIANEGYIDPEEALHIVKQVGDALFYAHRQKIIHRDIKPDNIMFRNDGTPVLLDFGIAKAMDSNTRLTMTGMSIGTPYYMSPEQCQGDPLDGRSDIYALGIMLYEMITGKLPFFDPKPMTIILKHLREPLPRLPLSHASFQPLLDRMTAKNREERPGTPEALHQLIKELLNTLKTERKEEHEPVSGEGETILSIPALSPDQVAHLRRPTEVQTAIEMEQRAEDHPKTILINTGAVAAKNESETVEAANVKQKKSSSFFKGLFKGKKK